MLGCLLVFVATTCVWVTTDPGQAAPVRWAAFAMIALCLILGTILQLRDRL